MRQRRHFGIKRRVFVGLLWLRLYASHISRGQLAKNDWSLTSPVRRLLMSKFVVWTIPE